MKTEIIFALCCAGMCAAMLWCMSNLDETFYICVCAFMAAFWGSLAAFVAWSRICEPEPDAFYRPPVVNNQPNRRR
jgi:hypothetical protein